MRLCVSLRLIRIFQFAQQTLHRGIFNQNLGQLPGVGTRGFRVTCLAVHRDERAKDTEVIRIARTGSAQPGEGCIAFSGGVQPDCIDISITGALGRKLDRCAEFLQRAAAARGRAGAPSRIPPRFSSGVRAGTFHSPPQDDHIALHPIEQRNAGQLTPAREA